MHRRPTFRTAASGYPWQNRPLVRRISEVTMGLRGRASGMVAFLRRGYPSGTPAVGYAPLLALLPRRVCDDEVTTIASTLLTDKRRPIDSVDVGVELSRITDELPSLGDIERVRHRLTGLGWDGGHGR
jgi:uncharacterized protein DUF3349